MYDMNIYDYGAINEYPLNTYTGHSFNHQWLT